MSPKIVSYLLVALAVVAGTGPGLANALLQAGLPVAAHVVGAIVAFCAALKLAFMPSVGKPKPAGDRSGSAGFARLSVMVLLVGICAAVTGAQACTKAQALSNVEAAMPAVTCVLSQIFQGDTDPATIAVACDGVTAEDILSIINGELQAESAAMGDAGPSEEYLFKAALLQTAKARATAHLRVGQ